MRLYTRTGDQGQTSLHDGSRVWKSDLRVECFGHVDELNAALGVARAALSEHADLAQRVEAVQHDLFVVGSDLATPVDSVRRQRVPVVRTAMIERLERWIDEACAEVPPPGGFVLPGGVEAAARLHYARAVCRRAERAVVDARRSGSLAELPQVYLNRLSDLLFAWARVVNHRAGCGDVEWRKPSGPGAV